MELLLGILTDLEQYLVSSVESNYLYLLTYQEQGATSARNLCDSHEENTFSYCLVTRSILGIGGPEYPLIFG